MSTVAFHVDIEAGLGHVWRWLEEAERLPEWMPEVVDTTFLNNGEAGPVGGRFVRTLRKGGRLRDYQGVVTAFESRSRLSVRIRGEWAMIDMTWRLFAIGTGTRVDFEMSTRPLTATGGLIDLVTRPATLRRMRRHLSALKCLAEQEPVADIAAPLSLEDAIPEFDAELDLETVAEVDAVAEPGELSDFDLDVLDAADYDYDYDRPVSDGPASDGPASERPASDAPAGESADQRAA